MVQDKTNARSYAGEQNQVGTTCS